MTKSNDELLKYWPVFEKYNEYTKFKGYPEQILRDTVEYFDSIMRDHTKQPVSKWTLTTITSGLKDLAETAGSDPDYDAKMILFMTYGVVTAYLRCLAVNQLIETDLDDLQTYLMGFEKRYDLEGPVIDPSRILNPQPVIDDPNLPQWLDYVARDIDNYTKEWLNAYYKSPDWKKRKPKITSDLMTYIFTTLVGRIYDEYRKTPKTWTKKAITGVLTGYFVSNTDLTAEEFQQVEPALNQFLTYVAMQGWLNAKRAGNYERFITAAAPEMIARSEDPQNAGPAKKIGMALAEQGIDINDDKAVNEFIEQVNANGGIDSLYNDDQQFENDELIPDELKELLTKPKQFAAAAKIYDPYPDQGYLEQRHVSAGWSKDKAIKTHTLAVETGIRLWLQRSEYAIPKSWDSVTVVFDVVDFIDVLYAQNLVTPDQWSVSALAEFGKWHRDNQSASDYQNTRILVAGIVGVLYSTGVLTQKQARQLPVAFNGEAISENNQAGKVTGKVMSMKQARKLLKDKKRRS